MQKEKDELYMRRAFDLALNGKGQVSPNPMVGCVIVKDDRIIGEGYHQKYGGPHAEVNAIASVASEADLAGATLYVNLEPCAHFGKTPPCADLVIRYPFKRVVVCNKDPFPLVAGKGAEKIAAKGIEVMQGILDKEGRRLNRRFFTFIEKKRPFIILKWAETADGFIARKDYSSKWISNEMSRRLVHQWRSEEDAVMVGTKTAIYDNPQLNVRDWQGRDPVRIIIDKELKIDAQYHLFDQSQKTLCYNLQKNLSLPNLEYIKINTPADPLSFIISDLYERKVQSVIVEGGANLLSCFIHAGWWDEARIFRSSVQFGEGIAAPQAPGKMTASEEIGDNTLGVYIPV